MRTLIAMTLAAVAALPLIAAQKPEATSLAGKPLYPIELPNRPKLEADLAQAKKDFAAKPNDTDTLIWVGRRLGYLPHRPRHPDRLRRHWSPVDCPR